MPSPDARRIALLGGEPGIGKTRLAEESRSSPARGARRLCGAAATRVEALPPSGRGRRSSGCADATRRRRPTRRAGQWHRDVAQIAPEVKELVAESSPSRRWTRIGPVPPVPVGLPVRTASRRSAPDRTGDRRPALGRRVVDGVAVFLATRCRRPRCSSSRRTAMSTRRSEPDPRTPSSNCHDDR